MSYLTLSVNPPPYTPKTPPQFSASSSSSSPSTSSRLLSPLNCFSRNGSVVSTRGRRRSLVVVGMAPDEEKLTRRSPLEFPIEWERPKPGRRPDIFPEFSPMKTPLPPPMPYDPPPQEDDEDEEKKEEEEEGDEEGEEGEENPGEVNPDEAPLE